jgi:hypothetical protein
VATSLLAYKASESEEQIMPPEGVRPDIASNDLYRDLGREFTARLQLRTQILFGFVTISSTLIAASLAQPYFTYLDIGVGFLALFTAALSAHHEIIMANLRLFQKMLVDNANPNLSSSWLHFQTENLMQEERVGDWTQLFLYLVIGVAALSTTSFPLSEITWILFSMSAGCFMLSLACIIYGWKKREKIDRKQLLGTTGT